MPTLRMLFAVLVLYVLFTVYSAHVNATENPPFRGTVKVEVTSPAEESLKTAVIDIIGTFTEGQNFITYITAYGSTIKLTYNSKAAEGRDKRIVDAATDAIAKACR